MSHKPRPAVTCDEIEPNAVVRKRVTVLAVIAVLTLACCSTPIAPDLVGEWTSDGNYVFRFERRDGVLVGAVRQPSTGREFAIEDIVVNGSNVRFFVVHGADWDEEVQQNGGKRFRNTAEGAFTDTELKIHGSREESNERAYEAVMKRVAAPGAGTPAR